MTAMDENAVPPVEDAVVTAPDGRLLAGSCTGPVDGRPVLFVAGAATGRSMVFGAELLAEKGIRLLTMDRPGIGSSTPDPARTIASTAADYRAFVDGVLGAFDASVPVVANSQGGVFALALALSGGASRLVLVSPADELAHPAVHAQLPAEATALADLALNDRDAAETVLAGFDAAGMEAMVLGGSDDEDRAFYTAPGFLDRYRRALAEGFANAGQGYVRDTVLAMRPWALPLDEVACPVTVLFGARDRVHSPDLGATLAGRMPHAARTVIPEAGGALLWTHAAQVLDLAVG